MSLIKKLTPIEPDAIWIVRIVCVTLSIPLILLSIYCFVGIVNINNEMDEMYANTNTEVQPLPKPVRDYVLAKPSKKTFCTKMALGEDRSALANYRCWDEQGEYFRPTWEEFDQIN